MRNRSLALRRRLTVAVFLAALLARLLYWQATPDREWPHSALYKGDAWTWVEWASAIDAGRPFELGLPIRPPGNAYLLAMLGVTDPGDAARGKLVWCLFGALAVTGFFRAAWAGFGLPVALAVAVYLAFSTALLELSASLNNETPYLALVAGLLLLAVRLERRPAAGAQALWGALSGVACLFRVEHLLFFVLATLWLALRWRDDGWRPAGQRAAGVAAAFAATLLPWHLSAWAQVERFNTEEPRLDGAGEAAQRSVERATSGLEWTPEALAMRAELPAFTRRSAANFVAATMLVRGERRVTTESFDALEEGFGYRPEPLAGHPFVALYGPLNFFLAHNERAAPGFARAGLDRPPVLAGGIDRFPRALLGGLPPRELAFIYPPHLEAVNRGVGLGVDWIRRHPRDALRLTWARARIFWQGAGLGWTGRGLPAGASGVRRAVDLTVPEGGVATAFGVVLLAACAIGLWRGRREVALAPWLLFAAAKLAAALLFFGYARHGATCAPVVALMVALAVRPAEAPADTTRRWLVGAGVAAALGVAIEVHRWLDPPAVTLDGRSIEHGEPFEIRDHQDRRVATR